MRWFIFFVEDIFGSILAVDVIFSERAERKSDGFLYLIFSFFHFFFLPCVQGQRGKNKKPTAFCLDDLFRKKPRPLCRCVRVAVRLLSRSVFARPTTMTHFIVLRCDIASFAAAPGRRCDTASTRNVIATVAAGVVARNPDP